MTCVEYLRSNNPRTDVCCRCGRSAESHQAPLTRPRDVDGERRLIREAARGAVDPSALISFAERRISAHSAEYVRNPMLVSMEHDKRAMAREEFADGVNYLAWLLQEHPDEDRDTFLALRHAILAFDLLTRDR